jgi:hypothetical protein
MLRATILAIVTLLMWVAYFVICSAPIGAPFIYADF